MFGFIKNLWNGNNVRENNDSSKTAGCIEESRIRKIKYNLPSKVKSELALDQRTCSVQKTNSDMTRPNENEDNDILNEFEVIEDHDDLKKITDNSAKNLGFVVSTDQNSDVDGDENHIDKESERRVKDFLDITKYSGDAEMSIGGIQMQKIKVGDNVYVFPKAMYEKSSVDEKEAAKRIDSGKQIYEKIKDNKNKGENDFVVIDELSKEDVSNLVWFLEYKACRKNNKYSSNSSNMRIPDGDGKIYDAIRMAINKDKMMQQEEFMEGVENGCLVLFMNRLILKPKMRKKLKNLKLV